jgi:hypothetical protein
LVRAASSFYNRSHSNFKSPRFLDFISPISWLSYSSFCLCESTNPTSCYASNCMCCKELVAWVSLFSLVTNSAATSCFNIWVASDSVALYFKSMFCCSRSRSSYGTISCKTILEISSTFSCFFYINLSEASFLFSYKLVPEASSRKLSVCKGFMLITRAMRPCITKK